MLLSEIYSCVQGEGLYRGVPSILVRTSTCNLRCQWKNNICDTPFTSWRPEINFRLTPQEVFSRILSLANNMITHVIISGGEPLIQATETHELASLLQENFQVTIETNGSRFVPFRPPNLLFSISPKLKTSTPTGTPFEKAHETQRINLYALDLYLKNYHSYLKFVVSSLEDLQEIQGIQKALSCPSDRIYLMPEGVTAEEVNLKKKELIDLCMKYGYRFTSREHIEVFGNIRKI